MFHVKHFLADPSPITMSRCFVWGSRKGASHLHGFSALQLESAVRPRPNHDMPAGREYRLGPVCKFEELAQCSSRDDVKWSVRAPDIVIALLDDFDIFEFDSADDFGEERAFLGIWLDECQLK